MERRQQERCQRLLFLKRNYLQCPNQSGTRLGNFIASSVVILVGFVASLLNQGMSGKKIINNIFCFNQLLIFIIIQISFVVSILNVLNIDISTVFEDR